MITRLCASNYRSIGEGLDLRLGPLTVLVGPNGSGKSNVIDVFQFLHDCVKKSLSDAVAARQGFGGLSRWSPGKRHEIDIAVECSIKSGAGFWGFSLGHVQDVDATNGWNFRVNREFASFLPPLDPSPRPQLDDFLRSKDGRDLGAFLFADLSSFFFQHTAMPTWHPLWKDFGAATSPEVGGLLRHVATLRNIVAELQQLAIYSLFPNTLRAAQNPNPVKPMLSSGGNWASTLKALNKKEWGVELCAALKKITGDIDDYHVLPAGGFVIPEFRHGKGKGKGIWRGAAQESDGTLRIAAMLTALFQEPAPALIGFEEPELAVHPGALPILYDYLLEASERSQIVITTHSPELMDLFDVECIRVVERKNGVTTVGRIEERQRELVRKRLFSTSELLYSEGLRPEGTANDE